MAAFVRMQIDSRRGTVKVTIGDGRMTVTSDAATIDGAREHARALGRKLGLDVERQAAAAARALRRVGRRARG